MRPLRTFVVVCLVPHFTLSSPVARLLSCCWLGLVAAPLSAFVAAPACAQGFDDRFPDPIATQQLVAWFGPLLATPKDAWTKTLELHRGYLAQQQQLRNEEIEAWIAKGERGVDGSSDGRDDRDRERARRRLLDRIEALDGQLFDGIATIVDPSVVPVVEWLKVHRALETCECGLAVQTQEVSFSLLSYSEEAMEEPPLVWASPQAGTALAEYDRRILQWGRKFLKAHRAWQEAWQEAGQTAMAAPAQDDPEPRIIELAPDQVAIGDDGTLRVQVENVLSTLILQRGRGGRGSGPMPAEYAELMDFMRAQQIEIVQQAGDDGEWEEAPSHNEQADSEAAWREHGRALAYMGRRMHGQIESSLDGRTRLLFRLRIMNQVVDLSDPATRGEGRRGRDAAPTLRRHLREMQQILDRAVDARSPIPIDVDAIEAISAAHWQAASGVADELLKISRKRSDVLFKRGEQWQGGDDDPMERRRVALVRQWEPLAAEAVEAMRAIVQQGEELHRASERSIGRSGDRDVPRGPKEELAQRLRPFRDRSEGPDDTAGSEPGDDSGAFDERRFHRRMKEVLAGPLTSKHIIRSLGWAPSEAVGGEGSSLEPAGAPAGAELLADRAALQDVIRTLRADVLDRAWGELDSLLLVEDDERRERGLPPLALDQKVTALLAIRDIVRNAEERLIGEVAAIVPTDADRLRLRLLLHSVRFQRSHWPWDDVPGLDSPALRPIDLAALVLDELHELAGEEQAALAFVETFFTRSDGLLTAAASTGDAFIAVGRLMFESRERRDDERLARQVAAAQASLAMIVRAEVQQQWEAIEELVASLPPTGAMRLRRIALHAATGPHLTDDESEAVGPAPDRRPVIEHGSDPQTMVTVTEMVDEARLRHLDRLLEGYRDEALRQGVLFPKTGDAWSPAKSRLARVQRRMLFDLAEVNAQTAMALASLMGSDASARAAFGAYGLVGPKVGLAPLLEGVEWEPGPPGR